MEYQEFYNRTISVLSVGTVLQNPGGGTTEIIAYTGNNITYKRGNSKIRVSMIDLYGAYNSFCGKTVSSSDLRKHAPRVFDSKKSGHSCNCTTLFMILRAIGIIATIEGKGKRGNPFRVTIPATCK